jgi:hypothetical protein
MHYLGILTVPAAFVLQCQRAHSQQKQQHELRRHRYCNLGSCSTAATQWHGSRQQQQRQRQRKQATTWLRVEASAPAHSSFSDTWTCPPAAASRCSAVLPSYSSIKNLLKTHALLPTCNGRQSVRAACMRLVHTVHAWMGERCHRDTCGTPTALTAHHAILPNNGAERLHIVVCGGALADSAILGMD